MGQENIHGYLTTPIRVVSDCLASVRSNMTGPCGHYAYALYDPTFIRAVRRLHLREDDREMIFCIRIRRNVLFSWQVIRGAFQPLSTDSSTPLQHMAPLNAT